MDDDDETTYETAMFLCLTLKYTFICVHWWTRQRIHNTLIVVDRYLRLMGDKTIPDSAEPRCRYRSTTSRCSGFLQSRSLKWKRVLTDAGVEIDFMFNKIVFGALKSLILSHKKHFVYSYTTITVIGKFPKISCNKKMINTLITS